MGLVGMGVWVWVRVRPSRGAEGADRARNPFMPCCPLPDGPITAVRSPLWLRPTMFCSSRGRRLRSPGPLPACPLSAAPGAASGGVGCRSMPELPPAAATAPLSLPVSSSPSVASEADDEYAAPLLLPAALPSEGRGRFRFRWWALLGRRQERGEEARPDCEAEEAASARTEAMRHSRVCMCMCVCECAIGTGGASG